MTPDEEPQYLLDVEVPIDVDELLPAVPDAFEEFCALAGIWHLEPMLEILTENRDVIVLVHGAQHPDLPMFEAKRRRCQKALETRRAEVWPPDAA